MQEHRVTDLPQTHITAEKSLNKVRTLERSYILREAKEEKLSGIPNKNSEFRLEFLTGEGTIIFYHSKHVECCVDPATILLHFPTLTVFDKPIF